MKKGDRMVAFFVGRVRPNFLFADKLRKFGFIRRTQDALDMSIVR